MLDNMENGPGWYSARAGLKGLTRMGYGLTLLPDSWPGSQFRGENNGIRRKSKTVRIW